MCSSSSLSVTAETPDNIYVCSRCSESHFCTALILSPFGWRLCDSTWGVRYWCAFRWNKAPTPVICYRSAQVHLCQGCHDREIDWDDVTISTIKIKQGIDELRPLGHVLQACWGEEGKKNPQMAQQLVPAAAATFTGYLYLTFNIYTEI